MGTRNEHLIKFLNQVVPALLKFLIISANHADPDKMLHSAASQLGLYGFPTYSPGATIPGIPGIKKLSKQFLLKIASDLLSSSYSLYCLQSEHREEFYYVIHSTL